MASLSFRFSEKEPKEKERFLLQLKARKLVVEGSIRKENISSVFESMRGKESVDLRGGTRKRDCYLEVPPSKLQLSPMVFTYMQAEGLKPASCCSLRFRIQCKMTAVP